MRLGILQTGKVNPSLEPRFGEYPLMFEAMLRPAIPALVVSSYAVLDGELPQTPEQCDAWLITGSRHGVYDDLPWIEPLKTFLRTARAAGRPLVGVCFGHQIMAEAFGGKAEKSERGWGCGVHRYTIRRAPGWMEEAGSSAAWHAMHQDQVTAIPPDATVLADSSFCPFGMLAYGDPERPEAISIQPHPEFGADYARELVTMRAQDLIPPEVSAPALLSIDEPVDRDLFARWVARYLETSGAGTA